MSALRESLAWSLHRWILATFAVCGGHPADPDGPQPECEQAADCVIGDLGWPEAGP